MGLAFLAKSRLVEGTSFVSYVMYLLYYLKKHYLGNTNLY